MPKETLKIDSELIQEFGRLVEDEGRKIEPEERTRKTLWALDALKQENKINSDTTLSEAILTIEERKRELRQTIAYAKETAQGRATDEAAAELHDVAQKEAATAQRLLGYLEAASSTLILMKTKGRDLDTPMSQIRERLEGELEVMETALDRNEESRRHESR
ncbi:MAG: hypothetical protein HYT67_01920 [Candidatus Yanofskybacteria bacterium]|nr:hypothetical protein [Candidatus Yanofskybacteria bacterium]